MATRESLPLGTRLVVRFGLDGDPDLIDAVGEVCWVRDRGSSDFPVGLGLRFLCIRDEALARVARFVTGRESIFYED